MTPLRAKMIRDMPVQRLAPKPPKASVTAVAGFAKFYQCSPDRLRPEQIRTYLHHLLVERRLAWSSCNQAAAGLKFFSTKTLGWDVLRLHLPPRTGRSQLHRRALKHMNHDSQDQHSLPVRWCCETITPIFRRAPCWSRAMIPAVVSSYKRYLW
jgi:hypothetical protein